MLDVDGTLLEIAETPSSVVVAAHVPALLRRLDDALGGAFALVSGRPIREVDALLAPYQFAIAGIHGLESRDADGAVHRSSGGVDLSAARVAIRAFVEQAPGTFVEDKGPTLAVHYRQAPDHGPAVVRLLRGLAEDLGDAVEIQKGKMVVEIKPALANKGTAVERIVARERFQRRLPVYVGDDLTDETAFAAANRMKGLSIRVGATAATCAKYSLESVTEVHRWLDAVVVALEAT